MKQEFSKAYKLFLEKWGQESQERMAIEEMSELTKELCKKFRCVRGEIENLTEKKHLEIIDNIKEEIADVLNMLEQLETYYGEEEIEQIRRKKIERTLKFLSEEE